MPARTETRFVIIGAGAGGICAGIRLLESGRDDFVILEKDDGVGGTWYRNTYPGACCDIASHLYSYSFAPYAGWSKPYGTQPEIQAYLERVAEDFGVRDHIRLNTGVHSATWDDARGRWTVTLESGEEIDAQFVISAVGMFGALARPTIEGLDAFTGTVFHSAAWDHDHDLTGERVAVIGSAASAVQFIPEIAVPAAKLHVFQRTANWVLPKDDVPYTAEEQAAFRAQPELMAERRQKLFENTEISLNYFRDMSPAESVGHKALEVVEDPEVRRLLTPDHPFGCKRPLLSNNYLQTFNRPNVELVVTPIDHITADAVVTTDGVSRPVDTIVLATGFETTKYASAVDVVGRDGVALGDAWKDGAEAYLGVTTAGFPNLFMLYGPNTNSDSIITLIEYQADHVLRQIERLVRDDLAWIDVRPEHEAAYNADLQRDIAAIDAWQGGCTDYYHGPDGRIVTQWPRSMRALQEALAGLDEDAYESAPRATRG